jgi:hypothetical protein
MPHRASVHVRAVVGGVEHDGVVGDAEFVEQVEELADMHVVLDHAGGVFVDMLAGDLVGHLAHLVASHGCGSASACRSTRRTRARPRPLAR